MPLLVATASRMDIPNCSMVCIMSMPIVGQLCRQEWIRSWQSHHLVAERTGSLLKALVTGPLIPDDLWQGRPRHQMGCQGVAVRYQGLKLCRNPLDLVGTEGPQVP